MNLFRKTTATVALVTLVSGIFSTGVSAYSTAEVDAANELAAAGIINNHSADPAGYNLDQNVLRQEIAAVARGVAGLDKKTTCDNSFADVSATTPNTWACFSVEALLDAGLVAANENFRPEANITKAEAVGMMVKAAFGDEYMYDESKGTSWQEQVVAFAAMNGVVSSFTNYDTPATRGFVFEAGAAAMTSSVEEEDDILSDLLEGLLDDEDTSSEDNNTNEEDDVVVTPSYGTDVEVTLNPMSANSQTVPNTGLVTFGKFDITAGSEDSAITSIKLERSGLSQRSDISRVYFEQNSKRISSRGSVNIDDEIIVSFTPALVVKAGSTETIDLVVELAAGADTGAEHKFAIVEVEASTDVANNLPVVTNTMKLGSYAVKAVTFNATDDNEDEDSTEINVGDSDILIGEFELITQGDKDNLFKSVTFRNNGGADMESVFANIGLYNDGVEISTDVIVDGREITFIVNHEIENGRTENYEIRADFISTERENDSFELELRNTTDLNVVELTTNFSAPIDVFNDSNDTMTRYSLVGGELLLTRDSEYTTTDTVSASTNDVVLLAAKLKVDEAITIEDLSLEYEVTENSLKTQFRDFKLVVDGRTVSTYTPNTSTDHADGENNGTGTLVFDGTFLVETNSSIKVLGNLNNTIDNNSTFVIDSFELTDSTTKDMRYVSNDEKVTWISGSVQGITVTVAEATLLATRNDGLNDDKLVSGSRDVELLGFSLRANDVSDVKVTSIRPTADFDNGVSSNDVTNVRLYEGTTLLKTESDFDFNSLNIVIPKNGAKSFRIVADFNTSIEEDSTFMLTLSDITARNVESNKTISLVSDLDSVEFTFAEQGTLAVTSNSSTRDSAIVTPSDSEIDVFTFDLEASDDVLKLTDLYITQSGTTAYDATPAADRLDLSNAVRSASLVINGRTIDGAIVSADTLYFPIGNTSPVVLEKEEIVEVEVRLSFNDSTTRESAEFQLTIGDGGYTGVVNGSENGMRVVSESTGLIVDNYTIDVESDAHLYSRGSVVATIGAATLSTQKFTVSADSNRRVDLDSVTFDYIGQDASSLTGSMVMKKGNTTIDGTFAFNVDGDELTFTFDNAEYLNAGTQQEFTVELPGLSNLGSDTWTREMRLSNIVFSNDLDTADQITNTGDYDNSGLPTDYRSVEYTK